MPARGFRQAKAKLRRTMGNIEGAVTERTLLEILIIGSGRASIMTPVDTSNLINSQYRRIERGPFGAWGRVGYTAAYASAVHAASGELTGQPRPNGRGNFWDPSGEPGFLRKGFEESIPQIQAAIKRGYKV